jgi:hypothetical protein
MFIKTKLKGVATMTIMTDSYTYYNIQELIPQKSHVITPKVVIELLEDPMFFLFVALDSPSAVDLCEVAELASELQISAMLGSSDSFIGGRFRNK